MLELKFNFLDFKISKNIKCCKDIKLLDKGLENFALGKDLDEIIKDFK